MKKNKRFLIIFLLNIFILTTCQGKKQQTEDDISRQEQQIREQIKKQTEEDLKKFGIKKILLYGKGIWIGTTADYYFKENGEVFIKSHPSGGFRNGTIYWKVENNELYINPNNFFDRGTEFLKMTVTAELAGNYSGINDLKRIKYYIVLEHNNKITKPLGIDIQE